MKINLNNKTELDCLSVSGRRQFVRGSNRDTLTFVFAFDSYSADELCRLFSESENTRLITITDDSIDLSKYRPEENITNSYLHSGYSLFAGLSIEDEVTAEEAYTSPETKIRVIKVTMGQKTYTEEQSDIQTENINALTEVVADMIGGAYNE